MPAWFKLLYGKSLGTMFLKLPAEVKNLLSFPSKETEALMLLLSFASLIKSLSLASITLSAVIWPSLFILPCEWIGFAN